MEDTKTGTSPESTIDYKTELEKAQAELASRSKELDQAKFTLKKKNIEEKKSKVFSEEESDEEVSDINKVIEEKVKQAVSSTRAKDFLSKHTMDPAEIALAEFHLENTIRPSGNPEVDALAALSVANQSKLQKQNSELKTSLINRNQMGAASQTSGGEKKVTNDFSKNLTDEQIATLRTKHGFNDAQIKMYLQKSGSRKAA